MDPPIDVGGQRDKQGLLRAAMFVSAQVRTTFQQLRGWGCWHFAIDTSVIPPFIKDRHADNNWLCSTAPCLLPSIHSELSIMPMHGGDNETCVSRMAFIIVVVWRLVPQLCRVVTRVVLGHWTPVCEPNPFSSNIILQLLINRVEPGGAKSLTTFNHFRIMLSMWIQCVPPLQANPTDSHTWCCLKGTGRELLPHGKHKVIISPNRQQHPQWFSTLYKPQCNSALNLTIQATVHTSLWPHAHRFWDHRRSNKPYFIQPSANLPQTVYSQWALLSGVCLWQPDSMPHLSIQSHERLASSDSSSQHTALSRSAFSPAVVSWTTSGDKRLPECLACRRFTWTWGWFILALHKQGSVYISLVLAF